MCNSFGATTSYGHESKRMESKWEETGTVGTKESPYCTLGVGGMAAMGADQQLDSMAYLEGPLPRGDRASVDPARGGHPSHLAGYHSHFERSLGETPERL